MRILLVALIVSISINLLLIGGIAGRLMAAPPVRPLPNHLGWIARHVDDEKRQEIRNFMKDNRQAVLQLRSAVNHSQKQFQDIARSEDVSEEELTVALSELRASMTEYQAMTHSQMAQVFMMLSQEERARVLDAMHEFRRGRSPKRP